MRMTVRRAAVACALAAGSLAATSSTAHAEPTTPEHAVIVCDSASLFENCDSAHGPTGLKRTLVRGNKVGHTRGAHPVYNGWAAVFDFGPNDWGYVRRECLGGFGSW